MNTRVLFVNGDGDFAVINFENAHGGTPIKDIMDNLEGFASPDDEWNLELFEFEEVDPSFARFIKTHIQDYDDSKNKNFFLESDILGEE